MCTYLDNTQNCVCIHSLVDVLEAEEEKFMKKTRQCSGGGGSGILCIIHVHVSPLYVCMLMYA